MNTIRRMIAIDCRALQDGSKFRGIGTMLRILISNLPNRSQYVLFVEKPLQLNQLKAIRTLIFTPPLLKKHYGKTLSTFLTDQGIRHIHFMAQYNIPDDFDFPFSVTVHDLFNQYLMTNPKKYTQTLEPLLNKLRLAKHIVAISHYTKKTIEQYLPNQSISVIHNGFDPSIIDHSEYRTNLTQLGIQKPYILYMGNFEKRKNIIGAIQGFITFSKRHPGYQLIACTGHRPLILPLRLLWLLAKNRHQITLLPFIKLHALASIYKNATALLFVSHAEGFGLPILEAMSVGTPAVLANTTSLPEVGQDAAVYVNPLSSVDIANGLEKVIFDSTLRKSLVKKMPHVIQYFDVKRQATLYDDLLLGMTKY